MNSMTKRLILVTVCAVVATLSMTAVIMSITRKMDARTTIMVWMSVIGVMILAVFVARAKMGRGRGQRN